MVPPPEPRALVLAALGCGAVAGVATAVAWPLLLAGAIGLFVLSHKAQWASELYCRCQATGIGAAAARRTCALVLLVYLVSTLSGPFRPFIAGQHDQPGSTPLWWRLVVGLGAALAVNACLLALRLTALKSDHQNPFVQHRNRRPSHVTMQYHTDAKAAAATAGSGHANDQRYLCLDGTWEFELVGSPEAARSSRFFVPATPPSRGRLGAHACSEPFPI